MEELEWFRKNLIWIKNEEEEYFTAGVDKMKTILEQLRLSHISVNEMFQKFDLPQIEPSYYDIRNFGEIFHLKERGVDMSWRDGYVLFRAAEIP